MPQRNKGILAGMRNLRLGKKKNKWHDARDTLSSSSEEAEITESGKRKHGKGDHQHPCKHPRLHLDINESDEEDYFVDALEEQPSTKGTTRFAFARIFQTRKEHRDMDSGYNYVGFQSAVRVSQRRPIRVTLMTSSYMSTIAALKKKLEWYQTRHGDVIKSVQILQLPYSGLSYYKFPDETQIDVMVLCHSINNRRFGITDVTDSLYDEFLAYCKGAIGKQNIVVIAHDFLSQSKEIREVTMRGFRSSQPTTFEMAGLAMVCGQMEHTLDMSHEDWDSLVKILEDSPKRVTHAGPASRRGVEQPPFMNHPREEQMKTNPYHFGGHDEPDGGGRSPSSVQSGRRSHPGNTRTSGYDTRVGDPSLGRSVHQPQVSREPTSRSTYGGLSPSGNTTTSGISTWVGGSSLCQSVHQPQASRESTPGSMYGGWSPPGKTSTSGFSTRVGGSSLGQPQASSEPTPRTMYGGRSPSGNTSTSGFSTRVGGSSLGQPQASHESTPRTIYICTSMNLESIRGLKEDLESATKKKKPWQKPVKVKEELLPYSCLERFVFTPHPRPGDALILCHSIMNRGMLITDVDNALYDEYLDYAKKTFGKSNIAVVIHDFDCNKYFDIQKSTLQRTQPKTFDSAGLVVLCGRLDSCPIEVKSQDLKKLKKFAE